MFEKVNPNHPDKVADRIAGAIVDLAYNKEDSPRIAVEVLIGHGLCTVIVESSVYFKSREIKAIVYRIAGPQKVHFKLVPQDNHLAQNSGVGDNGIFKGRVPNTEELKLVAIAKSIYRNYSTDGKYIIDDDKLTICQSQVEDDRLKSTYPEATINPLGGWLGGPEVDCGATNRKLGSDMGRGISGGGLHGKDLMKGDVSLNIYAHLKAIETNLPVDLSCSIGDKEIDGKTYEEIVKIAGDYIESVGGFEKFAEWGLLS